MRGLIPFRRTFSCICKPFDLIKVLTQSISSCDVEILSSSLTSPPTAAITASLREDKDEGHEQEDRKDDRTKKITAEDNADSTRTGTVTTIPFCIAEDDDDDDEEEDDDDRIAINGQIS